MGTLGDSDSGGEPVAKRSSGSRFDDMIDPSSTPEERRRQRRMLSNRESARRSRRRKENFLQVPRTSNSQEAHFMIHIGVAVALKCAF